MYKIALWILTGMVLAVVGIYQLPRWPTARSTGVIEHCPGLSSPLTPAAARAEQERRARNATQRRADEAARLAVRTGEVAEARRAGATYSALRNAEAADVPCAEELEAIASGERLRAQRREWLRVTALVLIVSIGLLAALYFGRMAAIARKARRG